MPAKLNIRARNNLILFSLSFIYIFVIGLFDGLFRLDFVYYTFISAIIIFSILTVRLEKKKDGKGFIIPIILVISTWVTEVMEFKLLATITGYVATLFFLYVIVRLVGIVANSKKVGSLEFLESINVYLLLGIAASVLFGAAYSFNHDSYNPPGEILTNQSDFIYYAFVTMTTLGYGDITPLGSMARSLSIFFSVAGQLYLTMIIAMLVGKYLNQKVDDDLET